MIERRLELWLRMHHTQTQHTQEATTMEAKQGFDQWALVELMGHQRIAGRVTEAEIGGSKFVRVDVPEIGGTQPITKFLGPASIYAITPVSEETALSLAKRIDSAPVSAWDARQLAKQLSAAEVKPGMRSIGEPSSDDEEDDEDRPF